jgi:fatty acid amide hydrolase 2
MDALLRKSGVELARLIRERKVTSRQVVDVHIARIQQVNPSLNAVVKDRFAEARDEADRADAMVQGGKDLPPFHGVPCSIKEAFALKGMPNSGGLVSRKNAIATSDAVTVKRLKDAGAIPIGVTNLSELCMWMESANRVYGRTGNAYDPKRIAGGSSGGEGSIVGAGGVPFGLGSDVGGSIRMPAFFNGVFGHKPTGGLIPNDGQFPIAEGEALRYLTTGPLARRAEDLYPLVKILADQPVKELSDLRELLVVDVADNGRLKIQPALREAQQKAAQHLHRRGAQLIETRPARFKQSIEIWSAMLGSVEQTSFYQSMCNGQPFSRGLELLKWSVGRSDHTLPAIMLAIVEGVTRLSPDRTQAFCALGKELRSEIVSLLGDSGVMLFPSYPEVAPRHHAPLLMPFKWMYTAIFNVLELPVTQVPMGLDRRGLPLGIQVVGPPGGDHLTMAVALELEKAFGGWVMPSAQDHSLPSLMS